MLLGRSQGFVGCTRSALPLVVPADISCVDGQGWTFAALSGPDAPSPSPDLHLVVELDE